MHFLSACLSLHLWVSTSVSTFFSLSLSVSCHVIRFPLFLSPPWVTGGCLAGARQALGRGPRLRGPGDGGGGYRVHDSRRLVHQRHETQAGTCCSPPGDPRKACGEGMVSASAAALVGGLRPHGPVLTTCLVCVPCTRCTWRDPAGSAAAARWLDRPRAQCFWGAGAGGRFPRWRRGRPPTSRWGAAALSILTDAARGQAPGARIHLQGSHLCEFRDGAGVIHTQGGGWGWGLQGGITPVKRPTFY